jgi:signal peptidase I
MSDDRHPEPRHPHAGAQADDADALFTHQPAQPVRADGASSAPADGDPADTDEVDTSPSSSAFVASEPPASSPAASDDDATGADEVARRPTRSQRNRGSSGSFWRELPVLLLIAFVLAFLLRTFVLQVFYIPSGSMQPTLEIDDRMVVEKLTYRFRSPERGEIVVFEGEPSAFSPEPDTLGERLVRGTGQFLGIVPASARDFVKRVIGLPGDEILIEGGQVFVNGEPLDEPYVVFEDPSDYGPVTVPEGALFFLGDNRPNSSDSRRSLGMVDADLVVGRAFVIIWPVDHAGLLTGVRHDDVPDASSWPHLDALAERLERAGDADGQPASD